MSFRLWILIGFWLASPVSGDPETVHKTTNIDCNTNPKYSINNTCLVKARDWNHAVAQMDCDLLLPLRNVSVHMQVFKKGYNNGFHPFLIDTVVNMCDALAKRSYLTYGTIAVKILKQFTNVNRSCPLTGHLMARNLYMSTNYIPNPPLGFYRITLTILENFAQAPAEMVGIINFYWETKEIVQPRRKPKKIK